ncbi:MAG: tRNA (N(6)-L-threonylcarbamoyladenosine(37)-C(2))-methylthiotransferase MtaB, partial [Desulfobaccales bacterium]
SSPWAPPSPKSYLQPPQCEGRAVEPLLADLPGNFFFLVDLMPFFRLITFGCKVNQFDSAMMAEVLVQAGFAPAPAEVSPDLVVVNTCTVTARADQQARQAIRRLSRQHPAARLLVTGCYAQRAPEVLAALPGVTGVFGNQEKFRLAEIALAAAGRRDPFITVQGFGPHETFQAAEVSSFPGRTRAWLKVQDGCSHTCAYCIVPVVRGPGRSLPLDNVLFSLENLAARGYQEIVLTGVDLGQYGQDLPSSTTLAHLLKRLARKPQPWRLRLSSLEPHGITGELLEALTIFPPLCPHFHLPLQSGSPKVLQAMNRPYHPADFRDLVRELWRRFPAASLGLDILVGFPGEREVDFEATRRLVEALPVAYLHVFPFSPRPGTAAHDLPPLPRREVQRRAEAMRHLGRQKKLAFYLAHLGQVGEVLVEGPAPGRPGWLRGLSADYLRVILPGPSAWRHRRLKVRYIKVLEGLLVGELVSLED